MNDKKADIIAVARAARVSPSTVSRAFNHPGMVKPTTRKKIDAAVRRLGYIRNRAAQTIHGIRSGTVGLIVPTIDHTIFAELIQVFSEAVEEFGFTILLASHGYNLEREYALTRKMLEHRVDGMALVGLSHAVETTDLLRQQKMPSLLLWNYDPSNEFTCVGSDNFLAGKLAAEHLLSLGHRKIATLFPPLDGNDRAGERFSGVLAALDSAGVKQAPDWSLKTPYSIGDAKKCVTQLVDDDVRPTAILCGNDVLAWGALHGLTRKGLSVPMDISVTGIGDFRGSSDFEPALTTVRIPARQIGRRAAEKMATAITSPETPQESLLLPPELVLRDTTCQLSSL